MATNPFGGWLSNNSDALLAASAGLLGGRTAADQVSGGLQGYAGVQSANKQKNKTLEFLRGVNPDLAAAVEAGALSPLDAYKTHVESQKPQKVNFESAGGSLYNTSTGEWITPPQRPGSDGTEAGLNLVYGQDENENIVGFQPLKSGGLRKVELPPGIKLTPGTSAVDLGTSIAIKENRSGNIIRQIPKDVAGEARQNALGTGEGKATADAQANIPSARQAASTINKQVQELKNDPYLPSMLGPVNSRLPNFSSEAARVQGKIEQLKGGAFLQARQLLKGGGAITDFEGQKAEAAYTRMNEAQTVEDFNSALDDFNNAVQDGVRKLEQQGGVEVSGGGARTPRRRKFNPATGTLE